MTAARFLVPAGTLARAVPGSPVTLDGEEGRHAAAVRRLRAGERLDVTDGAGRVASCTVVVAHRDRLDLRVDGVLDQPARVLRLVLVQALAKGGRDEQAIETATELGVDAVVPWQAARSVVRWDGERATRGRHRWEAVVAEATKQSRRAWLPVVEPECTTSGLATRIGAATLALVLHEEADRSLLSVELPTDGEVLVVVGPEGGIPDDELATLITAGAVPVRLGPEILRTSTAGPAALTWLSARTHRWT